MTNTDSGRPPDGDDVAATATTPTFRSAVGWSFVLTGGQQVFGLVVSFVLAAMLGPEVFGLAAMALVFIGFTQIVLINGLMPALIQRRELTPMHTATGFWMGMAASVTLALLCVAGSGWWASINGQPDLRPIIIALCALLPITALTLVQEALLRRQLHFRELAFRTGVSVLVGGTAGIVAAAAGAGVWSLVVQQLVMATTAMLVLWRVSDWRPSLRFGRAEAADLVPFTAASSASAVGSFVNNQGDALIIGLFFGPVAVGLYRFGARIVMSIVEVLARSLQGVSLPELARHQHDPEAVRRRMESLISLSMQAAAPVLGVVFALSPWLIGVLGSQWAPATTALRILAVAGVMRVFATFSGPLLQALNRPHLLAVLVWVSAGLSAGFYSLAGVIFQGSSPTVEVNGMAVANAALMALLVVVNSVILTRYARVGPMAQWRATRHPLLAGLTAIGVGAALEVTGVLDGLPAVVGLVLAGSIISAAALAALMLDRASRSTVLDLAGRVLPRRAA